MIAHPPQGGGQNPAYSNLRTSLICFLFGIWQINLSAPVPGGGTEAGREIAAMLPIKNWRC
jgi:hypothetical protein